MCLSTVYKNQAYPRNGHDAQRHEDRVPGRHGDPHRLMERQMAVEGTLEMANLVDGVAVVKENIPA